MSNGTEPFYDYDMCYGCGFNHKGPCDPLKAESLGNGLPLDQKGAAMKKSKAEIKAVREVKARIYKKIAEYYSSAEGASGDSGRQAITEFFDGAPDQTLIPTGNAKERRVNAKDRRAPAVTWYPLGNRLGVADRRINTKERWVGTAAIACGAGDTCEGTAIADRIAKQTPALGYTPQRREGVADRRVKQVPTIGLLRRIGEMDRRAHSTQPEPTSPADTTELLSKYRAALILAYELGKQVKKMYGIVPPKVLHTGVGNELITLSLGVN